MNGQENRTCRVVAFVSIDRNVFVIRRETSRRRGVSSSRGEYKWRKKKSEEGRRGCRRRERRSPLTSRQSGAAEVSMTPVRRRSADAARRVAHRLSSEEIIIMVHRAIQSENTISDRFFFALKRRQKEGCVHDVESECLTDICIRSEVCD